MRRKLKPTHVERTMFGEGDGSDLSVYDTALGRVGALCCWEHLQPLSKYAMYAQNEQVHIAAWPAFSLYRGGAYALGHEVNNAASRIYAVEGQCFVLAPCATVSAEMLEMLCGDDAMKRQLLLEGGGFTCIFAPDGQLISERLPETQEGLVYAEIDLGLISLAKAAADPAGHYARPDVTRLLLDKTPGDRVVSHRRQAQEVAVRDAAEPAARAAAKAPDDADAPARPAQRGGGLMAAFAYSAEAQALQQRFDTTALAAAELQVIVHDALSAADRAFIAQAEMFWLASVDAQGSPTVSFKGGAPGFVQMPDERTLLFPCFDGNGMFFSMGNIAATGQVGLLFMDFVTPSRLRVQGTAQLSDDPAVVGLWPGAQFAVKVAINALITNCPRYIPRMQRLAGSRYVPDPRSGEQPIPGWKRIDAIQGVLPLRDQGKADTDGGLISMDEWGAMVMTGDPRA